MRDTQFRRQTEHVHQTDGEVSHPEKRRNAADVAEQARGDEKQRRDVAQQSFPIDQRSPAG